MDAGEIGLYGCVSEALVVSWGTNCMPVLNTCSTPVHTIMRAHLIH